MPINNKYLRILSLALVAQAALFYGTSRGENEPTIRPLKDFTQQAGGWFITREGYVDAETQSVLKADDTLAREYGSLKYRTAASLFVAFFKTQRTGKAPHSPKNCLPGSGWEIWKHDSAMVPVNGQQVKINQYSIQNAGQRMLVFYWYQSKRRIIASEYMGKILLAKDALLEGRTAGSIVRITLPDTPSAPAEATQFAAILIPEVARCFGEAN